MTKKVLDLKVIGNDNSVVVDVQNTKQVVNGETVQTEIQQESIEVIDTPATEIVNALGINLPEAANDNTDDDPNAPGGGALVVLPEQEDDNFYIF